MKKILLLLLFINLSIQLFSQIKKELTFDSFKINLSFIVERIDTCYYENDIKIKTITKYAINDNSMTKQTIISLREIPKLYKTVFQYDKCGNLRCITKVYYTIVSPEGMNCVLYGYKNEDNIINNKNCDEIWAKSIF